MSFLSALRSFFVELGSADLPPGTMRAESGKLVPAPGYDWMTPKPGDFRTEWLPGKMWPEKNLVAGPRPGNWQPAPGYVWVWPENPDSEVVMWVAGREHPDEHLVAGDLEGRWRPAPGYEWVRPHAADSLEVRWSPGMLHSDAPHVRAAAVEGKWKAEPGYRWANRIPGDLRVERVSGGSESANGHVGGAPASASVGEQLQRIKDLATLGLDEGAGPRDIEAAFRRLARVHHPDRFAREGESAVGSAQRSFILLRAAYERLTRREEAS